MSDETEIGGGSEASRVGPGLSAGSDFAGYRIESELGRGGMGVVYRSRHLALDAPRALKVIAPRLSADPVFRARFQRESRLAASIDHPNVIPVHHAGEERGLLYLSMRLVTGRDLREIVDDGGPLELRRAARVISAVAAGLDAAHAAGLVHRDVKPANVLVEVEGEGPRERVFLTDFGISRVSGGGSTVTSSGDLLGSVDYVAPEQIEGGEAGFEADVYSLGCVTHFALTGEPPFVRDGDLARLYAHANAPRPRPSALRSRLPEEVDAIVARAMAIEPGGRYRSASEMAIALERALRETGPSEAPTKRTAAAAQGLGDGARRSGRRFGFKAKLTAAVALLVVLALAAVLAFGGSQTDDDAGAGKDKEAGAGAVAGSVGARIPVKGRPSGIAVGRVFTWTAANDRLISIADGKDRLVDDIKLPGRPVSVAIDFGAVWVVDREKGAVIRLEPRDNNPPVTIPTGADPTDVTTAYGSVWVANQGDGTVSRIDPETNQVIKVIQIGTPPRSITAGAKAIWVANIENGSVSKVEPSSNLIDSKPISVGTRPNDLDFGQGSLWVCDVFSGNVFEVDPERMKVIGDPIPVGARPRGIKVGFGSVWVANGADDTVTRIDPATSQPVGDPIEVGDDPADIAVGNGSVWTADSGAGGQGAGPSVTRIDP